MTHPLITEKANNEGMDRRAADDRAWHAWSLLERAARDAKAALDDKDIGPQWRATLLDRCGQVAATLRDLPEPEPTPTPLLGRIRGRW